MIPVFSTGLHCDLEKAGPANVELAVVIPVFSTGLHCDMVWAASSGVVSAVIPVFSTGLHCDPKAAHDDVIDAAE